MPVKTPETAAGKCLQHAVQDFVACANVLTQKRQDKAVHKLRRSGKKLRGALHVCGAPEEIEQRVRRICRVTGNARDALVLRQTWQTLDKTALGQDECAASKVVSALLASQHRAAEHHFPKEMMTWIRAETRAVHCGVTAALDQVARPRAQRNFTRMLQQVTERLVELDAKSPEKKFHALRKRLKRMLGATSAVEQPPFDDKIQKELVKLASSLGNEHDLTVLRDWLDAHAFDASLLPCMHKAISQQIARLRKAIATKANKLGGQLGGD